jgi:CRP-like cAMP-binding protein
VNGCDRELGDIIRAMGWPECDSDAIISALCAIASMAEFPTGTVIFSEGDLDDRLYFLSKGTVSLEMATPRGGKQRILTIGAGDLLAWSGLLGDGRMTSTATALEPIRMIEFWADPLRELCDSNHEVGYVVMSRVAKALSRRLLATRLQLLDLYHLDEGS